MLNTIGPIAFWNKATKVQRQWILAYSGLFGVFLTLANVDWEELDHNVQEHIIKCWEK